MNLKLKPWSAGQQQNAKVHKSLLKVDHSYQRERDRSRAINDMAKEWDDGLVHVLVVARRQNDDLYIVDGQGRWMAGCRLDYVQNFDCKIQDVATVEEEARLYKDFNAKRTGLKAIDIFKAELLSGDPTAVAVKQFVTAAGYEVVKMSSQKPGTIACVKELCDAAGRDVTLAANIFNLCAEITAGGSIDSRVFRGLFTLELCFRILRLNDSVFLKRNRQALVKAGQLEILRNFANVKSSRLLSGTDNGRLCAAAIIATLNPNRRTNRIDPQILDAFKVHRGPIPASAVA
jgi:hypothetical protein